MFKTKNGLYSRKRFSCTQAISYFIYSKLDKKTKEAISTSTQWGYGIHDYKTGKLFLIEYISSSFFSYFLQGQYIVCTLPIIYIPILYHPSIACR